MPVSFPFKIARLSRDEFVARDELVMRCAYASQNRLGRLCDERVYENDLAARLRAEGMKSVLTQVPITVTHGSFTKEYRLDLVADGAVYELKTVLHLAGDHDAQVLNYALLLDILCIKLLNFRNAKVEGKLRLAPVARDRRDAFQIDDSRWKPISPRCPALKRILSEVLTDLGSFLEARLYGEMLASLVPTSEARLTVTRDGIELGTHPVQLLDEHVAFCVTGLTTSMDQHRSHLSKLLECLPLQCLQWINFNHATVSLVTLTKGAGSRD